MAANAEENAATMEIEDAEDNAAAMESEDALLIEAAMYVCAFPFLCICSLFYLCLIIFFLSSRGKKRPREKETQENEVQPSSDALEFESMAFDGLEALRE